MAEQQHNLTLTAAQVDAILAKVKAADGDLATEGYVDEKISELISALENATY